MSSHWFKPKTHGYGAQPANWKGWAATFGFVVIELALVAVLLVVPALSGGTFSLWRVFVVIVMSGFLTLGFVWLAKVKTEGEWKWRWGEKDGGDGT